MSKVYECCVCKDGDKPYRFTYTGGCSCNARCPQCKGKHLKRVR